MSSLAWDCLQRGHLHLALAGGSLPCSHLCAQTHQRFLQFKPVLDWNTEASLPARRGHALPVSTASPPVSGRGSPADSKAAARQGAPRGCRGPVMSS